MLLRAIGNLLVKAHLKNGLRRIATTSGRSGYFLDWSPNAKLQKTILDRYLCLPMPECISIVKYVWIDGTGENLRSKSRTLQYVPGCAAEIPKWAYDGSSTYQAAGDNSDVSLVPVAMYRDPFRRGNNKLVLCETYYHDHSPTKSNHRCGCNEAINQACSHEIQFGIEQEYQLMDLDARPFGWPAMRGEPTPKADYYCGVGADKAFGRDIVEAHYRACLYAGVQLEGTNAEVTPSQWEYQVGICDGIKCGDDAWMARFILYRLAEEFGVPISLHPKLFPNWNGAGMHTNISTKDTRKEGGLKTIEDMICKLEKTHLEDIKMYDPKGGEYNKYRLTGKHETSSMTKFTSAVANRGVSCRIGREVADKKRGHLEDRRPASNADPYAVMNCIVRSALLS